MFAIETGWPPPELLVTVSITSGIFSAPSRSIRASSASTSILPLKSRRACVSAASGMGRSTARAPVNSMLARVVSKCVLEGTTCPGLAHHGEQDALGRAALVRRNHVAEAGEIVRPRASCGRSSRCRRRIRRRASAPPTARWTWRWCRNRSAGRSGCGWLRSGTGCSRPLPGSARAPRAWCGAAAPRS